MKSTLKEFFLGILFLTSRRYSIQTRAVLSVLVLYRSVAIIRCWQQERAKGGTA